MATEIKIVIASNKSSSSISKREREREREIGLYTELTPKHLSSGKYN